MADKATRRFPRAISTLARRRRTTARAFGRLSSSRANLFMWVPQVPGGVGQAFGVVAGDSAAPVFYVIPGDDFREYSDVIALGDSADEVVVNVAAQAFVKAVYFSSDR